MGSLSGWITLGLENLVFNTADVKVWMHNSGNHQTILERRFLDLAGSPVINQRMRLLLDECMTRQLGFLHLVIDIITDFGSARLPFQGLVRPGLDMRVTSPIGSASQQYPCMGVLNLCVYTELPNGPANYPHPPPAPFHAPYPNPVAPQRYQPPTIYGPIASHYTHTYPAPPAYAPYPNPGYALVAPQPYRPPTIYGSMATHFLGGVFGQLVSQVANQDMFGDGFNFADLIAGFFT